MVDVALPGLQGTNPLGYFAALGVLRTLARTNPQTRLRWEDGPRPIPVVEGVGSLDEIVQRVLDDLTAWRDAPVLEFENLDDIKLTQDVLRQYIVECGRDPSRSGELCSALVAEGVVDGNDSSKPTDLHFTAGQQKFLRMARAIRDGVDQESLEAVLGSAWTYTSKLPSLMWDVTDDRVYALSAFNPAKEKKLSEPGAEWLAVLGLSAFPVMAGNERTLTPGCGGSWKFDSFTWPLWSVPLGFEASRSLIGLAADPNHSKLVDALGCFALLKSDIRRSDQGGYGSFGPAVVIWQRPNTDKPANDPFAGEQRRS